MPLIGEFSQDSSLPQDRTSEIEQQFFELKDAVFKNGLVVSGG